MGTSYLLPMDRRLLPLSFRLLLVDARRKVTLWEGQRSGVVLPTVLCCTPTTPSFWFWPLLHSPQVQELSASLLIQADGGAGRLRWAGIPAVIFWGRGKENSLCGGLPASFSCQGEVVEILSNRTTCLWCPSLAV